MSRPGAVLATSLAGASVCFSTRIVRGLPILPEGNTEAIFTVVVSVMSKGAVYTVDSGVGSVPSSV